MQHEIRWVEVGVKCPECNGNGYVVDPISNDFYTDLAAREDAWIAANQDAYHAPAGEQLYAHARSVFIDQLQVQYGINYTPAEGRETCAECEGRGEQTQRLTLEQLRQALGISDIVASLQDRGQF